MTNERRKAMNEDEFRELNERLEDRALQKMPSGGRFEIVCECNREECNERIEIVVSDYEAVRASPTAFVVLPGHTDPTCERTVWSTDSYEVVEKFGEAALVAERESPR
jgi:hypothetical protein